MLALEELPRALNATPATLLTKLAEPASPQSLTMERARTDAGQSSQP